MLYELKKDPNWNKPKSFFVVFILLVDLVPVNCTVMKLYLFLCKRLIKPSINQTNAKYWLGLGHEVQMNDVYKTFSKQT